MSTQNIKCLNPYSDAFICIYIKLHMLISRTLVFRKLDIETIIVVSNICYQGLQLGVGTFLEGLAEITTNRMLTRWTRWIVISK